MTNTIQAQRTVAKTASALAGSFVIRPLQNPAIEGARPILSQGLLIRLLDNLTPDRVPVRISQVFNLCGHAHRLVSTLALHEALGGASPFTKEQTAINERELHWNTLREHLQRIALDWSKYLDPIFEGSSYRGPDFPWHEAPIWNQNTLVSPDEKIDSINDWLKKCGLLNEHGVEGIVWAEYLSRLVERLALLLPKSLVHPVNSARVSGIANNLAKVKNFAFYPQLDSACHETGAWARLDQDAAYLDGGDRVASRWQEVKGLISRTKCLRYGVKNLDEGVFAYVEMSRGLLMHWVRWDPVHQRISDYKVLAPTEWNFHPEGILSKTLSSKAMTEIEINAAVCALDPCTSVHIEKSELANFTQPMKSE